MQQLLYAFYHMWKLEFKERYIFKVTGRLYGWQGNRARRRETFENVGTQKHDMYTHVDIRAYSMNILK